MSATNPRNELPSVVAASILVDNPVLRTKLSQTLFCPPNSCELALTEVIKFLTLAAENTGEPLTPSRRVDLAWHEFILFTRLYFRFCEQNYGKIIHHEPSEDQKKNSLQYTQTLRLYVQRFGEAPAEYWEESQRFPGKGAAGRCGNCEGDNQTNPGEP